MRSKRYTKGRSVHQDRVRDASARLQGILRSCDRLKVVPEDLGRLPATSHLRKASRGHDSASLGLFLGVLGLGVLLSALILLLTCGYSVDSCANNKTQGVQIQTMSSSRLPLDSPREEATLFNDSEDGEDRGLRSTHLRLQRGR